MEQKCICAGERIFICENKCAKAWKIFFIDNNIDILMNNIDNIDE